VPHTGTKTIQWQGVLVVAILGVAVRLVHIANTTDVPTAQHLIGDAAGYYEWSQRIAAGEWIGHKSFYQAPLYPYVLAVWSLFGSTSVTAIRILQALCGSTACAMLCIAASRIFCRRVGLLSGLMLALYGPAIYFDCIVQKASLDCLLVCAVLACIAAHFARTSWPRCALLGAVVSLLCLTRENAVAWHLVLPAWILFRKPDEGTTPPDQAARTVSLIEAKHLGQTRFAAQGNWGPRISRLTAYLLGAGLVLLPVGLRNYYVQGEFLLTTSQAGPNFYIGNNAHADGRYQPLVRGHETPTFEQVDATQLAERATGQKLTPRDVSQYWLRQAWDDIAADPARWLKLTAYKILLVWNCYEIADAESITIYRRQSPVLNALSTLWNFGGLVPLAVLGIAITWNDRSRLWAFYALIGTMTLAVAAFYVLARYRYPLVPLLIPFAAAGSVELWRRRARLHTAIRPLSLAIVIAMMVNWPIQDEKRLDALAEMNAGVALAQAGEVENAALYFSRAVAGHPTSAETNYNLALALAVQGKYSEAIPYYEQAIQNQFDLVGVHFNLAAAYEQTGKPELALKHFEIALQQDPYDKEAQAAINRLRR
jgi:tetratricopeptide (TPR) repeat protein